MNNNTIIRNPAEIIGNSELIINNDNSIFHLHLKPEHVKDNVIVVGDQGRVERVSRMFDRIEAKVSNREFVCHVGTYKGTEFTVLSTGIGPDNIDIAINELDATANIDFKTKKANEKLRSLNIVRIGTSGALQEDIPVDSFLCSEMGLGFDGLMHWYNLPFTDEANDLTAAFKSHTNWKPALADPYFIAADPGLFQALSKEAASGITVTAHGFYGPQGRKLRLNLGMDGLNEKLTSFNHNDRRITNFEMETSALFGLSTALGHKSATICAIIANRLRQEYSKDYKPVIDSLIEYVLETMK